MQNVSDDCSYIFKLNCTIGQIVAGLEGPGVQSPIILSQQLLIYAPAYVSQTSYVGIHNCFDMESLLFDIQQ